MKAAVLVVLAAGTGRISRLPVKTRSAEGGS